MATARRNSALLPRLRLRGLRWFLRSARVGLSCADGAVVDVGAEAGGGGSALTLAFGFEIDFERGLGGAEGEVSSREEREDEGGVGKTSSGGMFSPRVRVSLAIFFRRASRSLSGLSPSIEVLL